MKIGIFGCGGIGSNVAMNLIREGIHNLILIDFDRVDLSNLNRQFYFQEDLNLYKPFQLEKNLKKINPAIEVFPIIEKIDSTNIDKYIDSCDILVEAFDNKEMKKLLIEHSKNKFFVSANGIGGTNLETIKIRKFAQGYIVGDFNSDIKNHRTHSSKVMTVANIMSNIIYKYIKGEKI
ncbi:sulfur carrier protein ThiS adenylyltransferase ThiF [Cetobacterium sp. SF1]|uniref:sulfur carrier protein ThiS adenylyltransferase ThiF n=1 Tax=Cetobacterium sp. SF1 TaxID=3417654 RepID=UPI003CEC3A41